MYIVRFEKSILNHEMGEKTVFEMERSTVMAVLNSCVRAFTAVELKSYNAILAPPIYQKRLAAMEANL